MKKFMDEDFLLETEAAKVLFHNYAEGKPIVDFHNHLNVREIYEDQNYSDLAEVWLGGDHYKWRAMRGNGISEDYITGKNTSGREKYDKWSETVPNLFGNPLYHWTHLEIQRYFGIEDTLSPKTADAIWDKANELLATEKYSTRELLVQMNVTELCTTDDPADTLEWHIKLQEEEKRFTARPTFRPENAMGIQKPGFIEYMHRLSEASGTDIKTYDDLKEALRKRIAFFNEHGCRISDHSLEGSIYKPASEAELAAIFEKRMTGDELSCDEITKFRGGILVYLAKEYNKVNWVMQLHIGAIRNNSTRMFEKIGVDAGFDSEDDFNYAAELSALLDAADYTGELPKTILYNLNPKDIEMLGSMLGNFQDGSVPGKIQLGSGWWFCDHKTGMERQMETLCNYGVFAHFVGMVTDSRSFLSFPRHEYFRRILCNFIGKKVENGEYPWDEEYLGKMVENICYKNALNYLNIE